MAAQKTRVLIRNRQSRTAIDLRRIRKMATAILDALKLSHPEISILLLDDLQIQELNRTYLSRDCPTDVLSFPMAEGPFPAVQPHILGDAVISVETALRQSEGRQAGLYEELGFLLIHGILHLIGYDHEQGGAEQRRMRRRERLLMEKLREAGLLPV
jgi:probable rRNA maturation factor